LGGARREFRSTDTKSGRATQIPVARSELGARGVVFEARVANPVDRREIRARDTACGARDAKSGRLQRQSESHVAWSA
jgi:hypothetical protein